MSSLIGFVGPSAVSMSLIYPFPRRSPDRALGNESEQRRTTIEAQARSDGLRLLRTINDTQAHGQEGARADPTRAAHEAGLDVGSERYQDAMAYLIEQAALLADENTAFDVGDQHPHGYASYFFSRRAVKLLEEG
jgi:hypothetical protein